MARYVGHPDCVIIGPIIQRHKDKKKLTGPQLGKLIGKSSSWVKEVERGRHDVPLTAIYALARILGPEFVRELHETILRMALDEQLNERDKHLIEAGRLDEEVRAQQNSPLPVELSTIQKREIVQ